MSDYTADLDPDYPWRWPAVQNTPLRFEGHLWCPRRWRFWRKRHTRMAGK